MKPEDSGDFLAAFRSASWPLLTLELLCCRCLDSMTWRSPRPYGAEKLGSWHPLMGALEWFADVEPLIKKTGESPPMECLQVRGVIRFQMLP